MLTEGAIRAALLARIDAAAQRRIHRHRDVLHRGSRGDRGAARRRRRGVAVRLILDPNKDAFGRDEVRHSQPAGGERAGRGERRRNPRALVSHARRAVPHQAGDGLRRGAHVADARLGEFHAAQPRRLQPRSERGGRAAARLAARARRCWNISTRCGATARRSASSTRRITASTPIPRRRITGCTASWSRRGCRRSERVTPGLVKTGCRLRLANPGLRRCGESIPSCPPLPPACRCDSA